jgi:hypothetical protein
MASPPPLPAPPRTASGTGIVAAASTAPVPAMAAPVPAIAPVPAPAAPVPAIAPVLPTAPALPARPAPAAASSLDEPGARAVEIAAMLGDSVVGVTHCMDPRGGKPSPVTYACVAGSLACLLASATAFYSAIDTAASNKAALDHHTRIQKKPAYAFRPRAVSPLVEGVAFGGLALGLSAVTAGLVRARRERRSPFYRIGTAPDVQQPVEHAPSESFPLAAHLAIVLVLYQVAIEDTGANIDLAGKEDLGMIVRGATAETPPPPEPKEQEAADNAGTGASEEAPPMELEAGRAGDPKVQAENGGLRVKNNQVDPRLARAEALEAARSAGPLGSTLLRDSIASLTANHDFSSGFDDNNYLGPIGGLEGPGNGGFGMSIHGRGPGGGCYGPPCGIIGTGRYMTRAFGGDRYWPGKTGDSSMRRHNPAIPKYSFPTDVTGSLDRSIIKRYIKRNEPSIGYCYEKELLARPGIAGTVTIRFLITATGTVQSSAGEGFDPQVASCVAGVIGRISFPAPKDGGNVAVSYPFTFRAAGT